MKQMIAMIKKNKAILGGVVLVVLAALLVATLTKKQEKTTETPQPQETQETPVAAPTTTVKKPTTVTTPVDTRSYTELMLAYKDRTVQFNAECQVPPLTQRVFKVGSELLLDNRSAQSAKISFGGASYTLPPYGYKVVTLSQVGTFIFDCNERQNVTTVLVQK